MATNGYNTDSAMSYLCIVSQGHGILRLSERHLRAVRASCTRCSDSTLGGQSDTGTMRDRYRNRLKEILEQPEDDTPVTQKAYV